MRGTEMSPSSDDNNPTLAQCITKQEVTFCAVVFGHVLRVMELPENERS